MKDKQARTNYSPKNVVNEQVKLEKLSYYPSSSSVPMFIRKIFEALIVRTRQGIIGAQYSCWMNLFLMEENYRPFQRELLQVYTKRFLDDAQHSLLEAEIKQFTNIDLITILFEFINLTHNGIAYKMSDKNVHSLTKFIDVRRTTKKEFLKTIETVFSNEVLELNESIRWDIFIYCMSSLSTLLEILLEKNRENACEVMIIKYLLVKVLQDRIFQFVCSRCIQPKAKDCPSCRQATETIPEQVFLINILNFLRADEINCFQFQTIKNLKKAIVKDNTNVPLPKTKNITITQSDRRNNVIHEEATKWNSFRTASDYELESQNTLRREEEKSSANKSVSRIDEKPIISEQQDSSDESKKEREVLKERKKHDRSKQRKNRKEEQELKNEEMSRKKTKDKKVLSMQESLDDEIDSKQRRDKKRLRIAGRSESQDSKGLFMKKKDGRKDDASSNDSSKKHQSDEWRRREQSERRGRNKTPIAADTLESPDRKNKAIGKKKATELEGQSNFGQTDYKAQRKPGSREPDVSHDRKGRNKKRNEAESTKRDNGEDRHLKPSH